MAEQDIVRGFADCLMESDISRRATIKVVTAKRLVEGDKALVEARWLTANRGRAYSEFGGCKWCQQALNVTDARMASLHAAELLSRQSRPAEAKRELVAFDRYWPVSVLPDQLRLRRAALEGTFN